jgi:ketosteroid isomerase-like protein
MPGGRSVAGRPAIEALYQRFFGSFAVEHEATIAEVQVHGDWAITWGSEQMTLTPSVGGAPTTLQGFGMSLLRRGTDRRWRYARGINNLVPEMPPIRD